MPPITSLPKRLLVVGATGKQGGALISALLAKPSQPFEIYALTRKSTSNSAQKLAKHSNIRIIEGNLDNIDAVLRQIQKPLWGVFAVTMIGSGATKETAQGKALVNAAVEAQVSHIVFTATERGGQEKSEGTPTTVPHFASKYAVEKDIKAKADASKGKLTYTFLRPVAFFENLSNDFFGRGFVAMWRNNGRDRPLQMIATSDIGEIAAEAFLKSSEPEYRNQGISLAGDELSPNEGEKIFKDVTGQEIPSTYGLVGSMVKNVVGDLRHMFNLFISDGFGVKVLELRNRYPFMKDFGTWLREESAWKKA